MDQKVQWKKRMKDVTKVGLEEAFEMYLECGMYYKDGILHNPKNISGNRFKLLNLIYNKTESFNPYSVLK